MLQRVAEFARGVRLPQVPSEVVDKAKVILLHDLTVALAGWKPGEAAAGIARRSAASVPGEGGRLLVTGEVVTLPAAALATGAMMHARAQDDSQISAQMHLGCTALPALLALGDRDDATGAEFLTAMIVGYEVATVIGRGASRAATRRGFRPASIFGPFGAAAGSARLLDLDSREIVSALALAASFGGGVNQTWASGGHEWQYQVGHASATGLMAALLASEHVVGVPDALEGAAGFYRAFCDEVELDRHQLDDLGRHWNLLQVTFKAHPVCAINQYPTDVALRMMRKNAIPLDAVDEIRLYLPPHQARYPAIDNRGPFAGASDALMSAQFCVTIALSRGGVHVEDLQSDLSEQEQRLVERFSVLDDDGLTENSCRLVITASGGDVVDGHMAGPTDGIWDAGEARRLAGELAAETPLGPTGMSTLADLCLDLENRTIRELIDATLPGSVG